ncbi:GNAT family N-acetyltransferase [Planococcus donghaensis]|uniref:GNAT family N-acetyltransferase n=1 Tax=Planococcus donghaensis TaxID=414778 RepID=A0A1C7EH07_9BACL|nr:GNAT family N-acetyltransferase [Planococcus donghaensis]ANU23130.1 GNAT family N-acetyltransferase [Planococcus donghaensis]
MEFRQLTIKDTQAYYDLRIEALTNNPDAFATRLEDALTRPIEKTAQNLAMKNAFTFGAFAEGRLLGNVTLMRNLAPMLHHRGAVLAVYVTPSERGKGLASHLMHQLLEFAKTLQGLERLDLAVATENKAAIALYEKLGFEKYGTDPRAMKTPEKYIDENLMVKFL